MAIYASLKIQNEKITFNKLNSTQKIFVSFQWALILMALIVYPVACFIKLKRSFKMIRQDNFQNHYGFLVKNLSFRKKGVVFVYMLFLMYRLIFSMLPLIL